MYFAAQGLAVLSYDTRGVDGSSGRYSKSADEANLRNLAAPPSPESRGSSGATMSIPGASDSRVGAGPVMSSRSRPRDPPPSPLRPSNPAPRCQSGASALTPP